MSDLKADLQEIRGVGEATADAILDVLAEHDTGTPDGDQLQRALEAAHAGDYRRAAVYLKRWDNSRGE